MTAGCAARPCSDEIDRASAPARSPRRKAPLLAGLIGATNGLTFVIAPTAGTALYGLWAPLPIIVGGSIMALVACFVLLHPRFRSA